MPLCFPSKNNDSMSTDPTIRELERRIANEAKTDQKNLDHAIRDLKNAEKSHEKAIKVSRGAYSRLRSHLILTLQYV